MTLLIYHPPSRRATETSQRLTPSQRQRANFARQAMFAEFGFHHGKACVQDKFVDRTPEARVRWGLGFWFQRKGAAA